MNLKYLEKIIIAIIIFLGVVITTAFIIGVYNKRTGKMEDNNNNHSGSIILENINLL